MPRRRHRRITVMAWLATAGLGAAVAGVVLLIQDDRWWPAAACLGPPGFLLFAVALGHRRR
jgi:hypothetical protein